MATLVTGRMVQDQSLTLNDLTQSSGALMFRNKIINGNFDIWQRGTSFNVTADNTYTADRWTTVYNGSGATRTVSRQIFTLGQTDVPDEPTYFLRWNQSVGGSSGTYNSLLQRIESVKTLANKTITVTFYAKAAATMNIGVYAGQVFGTGGSPSTSVYTNVTQVTLGTSWQKYSVNLTMPSIAGKTLGSNNNNFLEISFSLPLNTTFTFDIAQVQVEEGAVATPFEQRPIGMELSLCQRYYYNSGGNDPMIRQWNQTAVNRFLSITYQLPVTVRTTTTDIVVTGDDSDGASFTVWTNKFLCNDNRTIYVDKIVTANGFLDLSSVIVNAEL